MTLLDGIVTDSHLCGKSHSRAAEGDCASPDHAVRPEGARHQWRKVPPRELSIDLVAVERFGWATGRRSLASLEAENLVLRQQIIVLRRTDVSNSAQLLL
jgi:hypothetical protein